MTEIQPVPQMITVFNPYITSILFLLALFIGKILFNMADIVTGMIFKKDRPANIIQCNLHETIAKEIDRMDKEQRELRKILPIDYVRAEPYEKDIIEIKELIKNYKEETISSINKRIDDLFDIFKK
jgi:hypothetical protein